MGTDQTYFDLRLPQLPDGTKDAGTNQDVTAAYNAIRNLAQQVERASGLAAPPATFQNAGQAAVTVGAIKRRLYLEASENIAYGQIVNFHIDGGELKQRLANATDGTRIGHGICNVEGGVITGATGEILLPGAYVSSISGLVPGTIYFLSTVAGQVQSAPPAAAGNLVQVAGLAVRTTGLVFDLSYLTAIV